jgi:hypothetical protein
MKQYRVRRWLRNWLTNFDSDQPERENISRTLSKVRESNEPDHEKSLNFRVWFANGGKVIQTNRYDHHKDRNLTSMYVITDEQDLGREIDKIVTMESLRG